MLRRLILALALSAGLAPAFAQVPAPVPALPDTERRTSYSLTASTCQCSIGFALFGDSTDYANWLEVFVNGVLVPQSGNWTISSPTGSLASIPRPITDAVLTFTAPQTGTVQIVGARRPRRPFQFNENQGVPARNLNQALTDIVAQNRETWDKLNDVTGRTVLAPPGETLALLPIKNTRASQGACFDASGNLINCVSIPASTFTAGNGITFSGTNPTTITNNGVVSLGGQVGALGVGPCVQATGGVISAGCSANPKFFNASGSNTTTAGTISASSNALALTSGAIDFANGQGIRINHAGAAFTIGQVGSLTFTPQGTSGATSYFYAVATLDSAGGEGKAILFGGVNGNATLSGTNYNHVTWTAPGGTAPASYAVYGRNTGGTAGYTLLGITNSLFFDDMGFGGAVIPDWLATTPPTSAALSDWLITTITSGAGSTSLVLAANATTAATTQVVAHDDTAQIQAAIVAAEGVGIGRMDIPGGSYPISSRLSIVSHILMSGFGYQAVAFGATDNTANGFTSTTLVCLAVTTCLQVRANDSVQIQNLGLRYPINAYPGTFGMFLNAISGNSNSNNFSSIQNVIVYQADTGIQSNNWYNALYQNLSIIAYNNIGIVLRESNFPSTSDSVFTKSFISGGAGPYHIEVESGGGWRIIDNKLNDSTVAGICVCLVQETNQFPNIQNGFNPAGSFTVEPIIISGGSMEGSPSGIIFNNNDTVNPVTGIGNMVISNMQINYAGGTGIQFIPSSFGDWISAGVVTGNFIGLTGSSLSGISVGGMQNILFSGNTIVVASGQTAINYGLSNTANTVFESGNLISPGTAVQGVTTPATPASTVAVFNTNMYSVAVDLWGGAGITAISVIPLATGSGTSIYTQSAAALPPKTVMLNPGDRISVTYPSGTFPNWVWRAFNP
jgi:hypothetical protein